MFVGTYYVSLTFQILNKEKTLKFLGLSVSFY